MRRMGIGLPAVAGRAAAAAAAAACAALLALSAFVPSAFANREISAPTLPDGSTMTVSDDVTRIQVDKLDERTHEAVKGARMQILARGTGEVVDEWTTDGTTHVLEKGLDVDVVYILREVEAPAGYGRIDDVEFFANEVEGTGITLLDERDDVSLSDAYRVALYEPPEAETVVKDRVETRRGTIASTGDGLPAAAAGAAACASAACAAIALAAARRRRRGERGDKR